MNIMLLEVNKVSFSYSRKNRLLEAVECYVRPGEVVGLLGKNGSGKSTLLYLICGLMFPQNGEIKVNGKNTKSRSPLLLNDIYLLPEEIDLPDQSVETYITNNAAFYSSFSREMFDNYMNIFELPKVKKLSEYSMGQKKKFIISFALATNTSLLLMDEPTNGMDIPSKSQFRKAIVSSMSDNKSIIISTHQVHDIESIIDRVEILHDKNILLSAETARIAEKLAFVHGINEDEMPDCIYKTPTPGGYAGVCINENNYETAVDLELLFNAVLANAQQMKPLWDEISDKTNAK